jgi:hypothetical protein
MRLIIWLRASKADLALSEPQQCALKISCRAAIVPSPHADAHAGAGFVCSRIQHM